MEVHLFVTDICRSSGCIKLIPLYDICAIIRRKPKKDPDFQQGSILDSQLNCLAIEPKSFLSSSEPVASQTHRQSKMRKTFDKQSHKKHSDAKHHRI